MIQLLFKHLFELLEANPKFLLRYWSIFRSGVRLTIAIQTDAGYYSQEFDIDFDTKEPKKAIDKLIADINSEFIEPHKGKEEPDGSSTAN